MIILVKYDEILVNSKIVNKVDRSTADQDASSRIALCGATVLWQPAPGIRDPGQKGTQYDTVTYRIRRYNGSDGQFGDRLLGHHGEPMASVHECGMPWPQVMT